MSVKITRSRTRCGRRSRPAVITLLFFTLTCGLIYAGLRDNPAAQVRWVMVYIAAFVVFWTSATLIMAARRPSAEERVVLWRWFANAIIIGSHVACLGVIWAVMPHASMRGPDDDRPVLARLPPDANDLQSGERHRQSQRCRDDTRIAGGVSRHPRRAAQRLAAIYVLGFAGMMFFLGNALNRTVKETVAARLASDASARQLSDMLREVAAQRDASTKFIASVSHDLGQPLQAVGLFFDQTIRAPDGALRDAAVDGVRNGLAAADQLLSHMLGHLRLEADAVRPHRSRVDLPLLLDRVAAHHQPAASRKRRHAARRRPCPRPAARPEPD